MNTEKTTTTADAKILSFQQKDNLAVIQFATIPNNTLQIITSSVALKNGFIEVKEVSDSGSVNELLVLNKSPHFIFMMDGDILDGAKQNRVLNTSVLLAPQSKTTLPVSCVESGRWNYKSGNFKSTDYVAPTNLRANKSMRVSEGLVNFSKHTSDQGEVWASVAETSGILGIKSMSSNLSDVFDASQNAYQKFLNSFTHHDKANGVLFFVNKKPLALDAFNHTDMMKEYFPKLLKGVALDVYGMKNEKNEMTEPEANFKTLEFMDFVSATEQKTFRGVALGEERRFGNETISGFELRYNNQMVHLTALSLKNKNS